MGFSIETSVSALTVFLQGVISFFSPCVLPLVPLYISYLAGGAKTVGEDGAVRYKRSRVMLNTLFFVAGVSFTFFLLGFGFTAAGRFFSGQKMLFARIGGILVVLFGVYQLGLFGSSGLLNRHFSLPFRLDKVAMNPVVALILGFTFSFAWTPCVGPALASVLLMASSAQTSSAGFFLIGLYTLGFVLPFLAVGLFTGTLLDLFKKYRRVVQYTAKISGALLILMGVMMITGWMNGVTGYLSGFGNSAPTSQSASESGSRTDGAPEAESSSAVSSDSGSSKEERPEIPAPDFTLTDQYGNTQTLSDYKGKVVFLNFWATWCGPCQKEMPDIQALYTENGENSEDLVILGVANPSTKDRPHNVDVSQGEVEAFLEEHGYTYPVAMDTTGEIFAAYGISAYPTTFMIDAGGNVFGYVSGMLTKSMMESIVQQTMESMPKED